MAIESANFLRRLTRITILVLVVALMGCVSAATAQAQVVTSGSILPIGQQAGGVTFSAAGNPVYGQSGFDVNANINHICVAKNGNVLILDWSEGTIYQISPGSTNVTVMVSASNPVLNPGNWWNAAMALDKNDVLYITNRYPGASSSADFAMLRVPYDPTSGTWPVSDAYYWPSTAADTFNAYKYGGHGITFDDYNNLVYGQEQGPVAIYKMSVSADGSKVGAPNTSVSIVNGKVVGNIDGASGSPQLLVSGMKAEADQIAVDHAGNVFFIEDIGAAATSINVGVYEIPAGTVGATGVASPIVRFDPAGMSYNFNGVSVDDAGNLYLSAAASNGSTQNGILFLPNEGTPAAPKFSVNLADPNKEFADAVALAPIAGNGPVAFDPRGFLWIPVGDAGSGGITSFGSLVGTTKDTKGETAPIIPNTAFWVAWAVGSANLGSSPVGTAGSPGTEVYYTFTTPATYVSSTQTYTYTTASVGSFQFVQPGAGTDFSTVTTNPIEIAGTPPTIDTTVIPCGPNPTKPYTMWSVCPYWVTTTPRTVGGVSGQLQMLDGSGNVLNTAQIYGIGQGAGLSFLGSPVASAIGSGYTTPGQVAVDSRGNTYVADAGLKRVVEYPAGVSILSGLTAPTGVAVDGSGNVYIGDSGEVIEVPYVAASKALSTTGTVIASNLGKHLNLAVDGAGDVFVADTDNSQVVKIGNPAIQNSPFGASANITIGSFTEPTAVAVDASGNVFVADQDSLEEVSTSDVGGVEAAITSGLNGPVTGLAVDASGSVYVAQSKGVIWIPWETNAVSSKSGFNTNDIIALTAGTTAATTYPGILAPAGVALDNAGNLYVSSATAHSVTELSVNGTVDLDQFGEVIPGADTSGPIPVYNIGNEPLKLYALSGDVFAVDANGGFDAEAASSSPACGPSTTTLAGTSCFLGLGVTPNPGYQGALSSTGTISSNASNEAAVTVAVSANAIIDVRCVTTTTISGIVEPTTFPGSETITATVALKTGDPATCSGTPTGSVKLKVTGNPNQTVALDANGVAQFSYKGLVGDPAGKPYSVGATYGGDGANTTDTGYAVSTASATFDVSPAASVITSTWPTTPAPLYVLLGSTNLLTINVSSLVGGTPTGTVNVMNGATILETVTLDGNGNAQYNTSGLAGSRVPAKLGTYNLTIVYSGDQNYATTSYNLPTFEVIPTSLLITSDPASLTTTAGVAVTATLTLQPLVTFTSTDVQFLPGCVITSLPQNAYCTFDVTTLQFYSSSPQTIHVTVSTNVPVNSGSSAALRKGPAPWALAGIFGFGLVGLAFGKKTRFNGRALTILCLVLLLAGSVFSVTACTNGSYTHTPAAAVAVTPAGTTNIIIQATDSNGTVISLPFTLPITVQ